MARKCTFVHDAPVAEAQLVALVMRHMDSALAQSIMDALFEAHMSDERKTERADWCAQVTSILESKGIL